MAQNLLNRYRGRHPRRSQAQDALLIATATSNARRVGDRSWARRMWRLKGYRRAERRKAEQQTELIEIRVRNARTPRISEGLWLSYAPCTQAASRAITVCLFFVRGRLRNQSIQCAKGTS